MSERELAYYTARAHAQTIVDKMGGVTIGGATLSDRFFEKWSAAGFNVDKEAASLRHWVLSAGYSQDGQFIIIYSNNFING